MDVNEIHWLVSVFVSYHRTGKSNLHCDKNTFNGLSYM